MGYDRKSFETIEFEDLAKSVMETHKGLFNDLARQEFEEKFKAESAELLRQIEIRDKKIAKLTNQRNERVSFVEWISGDLLTEAEQIILLDKEVNSIG